MNTTSPTNAMRLIHMEFIGGLREAVGHLNENGANDAMLELGLKPHFTAVNHWNIATQTYARNHPGAAVHCVTLDAAFPSQLVPKGKLDLLMAGIECTFFSRARGGKPMTTWARAELLTAARRVTGGALPA